MKTLQLSIVSTPDLGTAVAYLLLLLTISVAIVLIVRLFALWYWRINELVENQQKQIELLQQLVAQTRRDESTTKPFTNEDW